jgi:DNA-binding response OmpR family regulator
MDKNQEQARVMVIDDTIANLALLNELLSSHGYNTSVFPKAELAFKALEVKIPDLILLDINMPGMNGFEFCEKLKQDEQFKEIPIIFLSAAHEMEDKIKAFRIGGIDYITKPFQFDEVLVRVKTHIRLKSQKQELEESYRQLKALEESLEQQVVERTHELTVANARLEASQTELHKLNQELEKRVATRTLELQKANKELEKSLEKMKEDEEAGRIVQFRLLPKKSVVINGCKFQYILTPSMYMSGDFVNYFEVNDNYTAFYLIDVSGHGSASAFVTFLVKSFVHSVYDNYRKKHDQTILNPPVLLNSLNAMLLEENIGKYITMFFGLIKHDTGELIFANGGHFPFPILCSGDKAEMIIEKSCPVGLFESSKYKKSIKLLPEKFSLLILSDGILDIMPEKDTEPQLEKLCQTAASCNGDLKKFTHAFKLEKQKALLDDITMLCIQKEE